MTGFTRAMSADPWYVDQLDLADYLERLVEAHVRTFTFDNIDVSLGQHPGVSTAVLNEIFVGQGHHRRRECGPGACLDLPRSGQQGAQYLDVLDGRIQTIRSVINPDKLGHVGPVADAWAVIRETNQARRPTD